MVAGEGTKVHHAKNLSPQVNMPTTEDGVVMRLFNALGWRLRGVLGDDKVDRLLVFLSRCWRPVLKKPMFIGITGSGGKSTAKELLAGILSHHGRGVANPETMNMVAEVAKVILRTHPWHTYCISEIGAHKPTAMDEPLSLLRPDIGIVTVVANDHVAAYGSREGIAQEKGKLVAALGSNGTAVLNADDPLVRAMGVRCQGRVITFGFSADADLRAQDVTAAWPNRLAFTVVSGETQVSIQTQLCGAHWIAPALSAVGGGRAMGLSLEECSKGLATVEPFEGRMQPVTTSDGVTFIRDDFKAPYWTLEACYDFLESAQANRKILVIGEISDVESIGKEASYARTAKRAQDVADIVVFVGPWASSALKARRPGSADSLKAFSRVQDASNFVNDTARPGDLVLLKGTTKQDHLYRIVLARTNSIACWRDDCQIERFCSACQHRMTPSGAAALVPGVEHPTTDAQTGSALEPTLDPDTQFVVGLGNAGNQYANTPHNIGFSVLDRFADELGSEWLETPVAWRAVGSVDGRPVCLIKFKTVINLTGGSLARFLQGTAFRSDHCVLVYDDLDLPIGTIRARQQGSAGGHRGVASILEAFQTDKIRRVKVGARQEGTSLGRAEYVLTAFSPSDQVAIDQSIQVAIATTRQVLVTFQPLSAI